MSTSSSSSSADADHPAMSSSSSSASSSSSSSSSCSADAEELDICGMDEDEDAVGSFPSADVDEANKLRLDICGMDEDDYAAGTRTNGVDSFGNACLDLFLLDADAPPQRLRNLLAAAWDQDALTALKLVCHRHTVKRDREGFFAAVTWMLQSHPRVFVDNLSAFAELGYIQDLAGLLDRLLVAQDQRQREAPPEEEATHVNLQPAPAGLKRVRDDDGDDPAHHAPAGLKRAHDDDGDNPAHHAPAGLKRAHDDDGDHPAHHAPATTSPPCSSVLAVPKRARHEDPGAGAGATAPPSAALLAVAGPAPIDPEAAATENLNLHYDTLYQAMVDFFVDRLRSDIGHLNEGNMSMISLAADWCSKMSSPSEQTTLLRMDIARRLFPDQQDPKYMLLYLHRRVLDLLVSALKQQAPNRPKVRQIKLPHLIAGKFGSKAWKDSSSEERDKITEEWRTMVDDLRAKGSMRNCIAVCDVSPHLVA